MATPYKPKPIDTSAVTLPRELTDLGELLARNVHDVWSAARLAEGWTHGPVRDDETRRHPLLVPYEALSEEERNYDRRTTQETLKAIVAHGFAITRGGPATEPPAEPDAATLDAVRAASTVPQLFDSWRLLAGSAFPLEHYRAVAEKLLRAGEPLVGYDTCQAGLARFPSDVRLRQLTALALANSGAIDAAGQILDELVAEGAGDIETLGIRGRTHKTMAMRARGANRRKHLQRAHELYKQGFGLAQRRSDRGGAMYTGINAAATAAMSGDWRKARQLARAVESIGAEAGGVRNYWNDVARAEAALICGDLPLARALYQEAVERGRPGSADLSSTRRQARLLLEAMNGPPGALDECFPVPAVGILQAFRGPVPDPATLLPGAAMIVYAAVRSRRDLAAVGALLDRGHQVRAILRRGSIARESQADSVLGRCTAVIEVDGPPSRGVVDHFVELLQTGLAGLRAQALDTGLLDIAAIARRWRVTPRRLGTASAASAVRGSLALAHKGRGPSRIHRSRGATTGLRQEIVALLFADAVNFGRLNDEQIPRFHKHFVGLVASLTARSRGKPLAANTWGDGFYFVFDQVADAGRFALSLCNRVCSTRWTDKGLPADLNLRIALHAGPTYACSDPITGRPSYIGAHVSRAARIEPITPPGRVYASDTFAALVAVAGVTDFECQYVGVRPLAKNAGLCATYLVIGRPDRL